MTATLPYFLFALLVVAVALVLMADRHQQDAEYQRGYSDCRRDRLEALQQPDEFRLWYAANEPAAIPSQPATHEILRQEVQAERHQ